MAATAHETALIQAFFEVMADGHTERLEAIVVEDCADADRLPLQAPGRAGLAQKVSLFRAAHPDARIHVDAIEPAPTGVRVTWRTTARGLGGAPREVEVTWRFVALFEIDPEQRKIRSSRIESAEPHR